MASREDGVEAMQKEMLDCYLTRIDGTRNMYRFYRLSLSIDLFGKIVFTRSWGRIGTKGRGGLIRTVHDSFEGAWSNFLFWRERKKQKGYVGLIN